jgi:hypothetical protein
MSKEKEVEQEYVERYNPIDSIESTHYALLKSSEYSHETLEGYSYSDVALGSLYRYWTAESENQLRSERSRKVAHTIAERALFEVASRNGEVKSMEALYEQS